MVIAVKAKKNESGFHLYVTGYHLYFSEAGKDMGSLSL